MVIMVFCDERGDRRKIITSFAHSLPQGTFILTLEKLGGGNTLGDDGENLRKLNILKTNQNYWKILKRVSLSDHAINCGGKTLKISPRETLNEIII